MRIDPAGVDELDAVADLWVDLAAEQRNHGSRFLASENRDAIREELARQVVSGTLLVARVDGDVAGFVSFEVDDGPLATADRRGTVVNLYVRPEERGRGLGSRLLEAAEDSLADRGVDVVSLEAMAANDAAIRLYERRGYEPHRVELAKRLGPETDTHSRPDG